MAGLLPAIRPAANRQQKRRTKGRILMTELTRRTLFAGAAAAGAATALTPLAPARASMPQSGTQVPGFYRYKVGDYEITAVMEGVRHFPLPDALVANAKKEQVSLALDAAHLPKDQMTITYAPIVVNTGKKLIVIDTGNGELGAKATKGATGKFITNFKAAGFDPAKVDTVIISHFHLDHVDGLLTLENKPVFANAEVMVPEVEWKWAMDDANMAKARKVDVGALFTRARHNFGVIKNPTRYAWGKEVVPGITAMGTPGHTIGHTSFTLQSGSGKLLIQSDVTNLSALFVRHPDWHFLFDIDAPLAEQTRRKFFDMASSERTPIQAFHHPFPGLGYVEKDGTGYRWVPAMWMPTI
jgi:glyoxylase-like metal-dependent hydrolase (beta-lactamase superfamily II)